MASWLAAGRPHALSRPQICSGLQMRGPLAQALALPSRQRLPRRRQRLRQPPAALGSLIAVRIACRLPSQLYLLQRTLLSWGWYETHRRV